VGGEPYRVLNAATPGAGSVGGQRHHMRGHRGRVLAGTLALACSLKLATPVAASTGAVTSCARCALQVMRSQDGVAQSAATAPRLDGLSAMGSDSVEQVQLEFRAKSVARSSL
jgi:hypothetical protein